MPAKSKRVTRKNGKGQVLNVRSHAAVKAFEKRLSSGPLTLVYINAKWCGACHRFNDEVWSHLTKLKNKSVNLASVDSEMIGKTSLANVPRKFYPTLMLVGKDKKPATFEDEDGNPTNAMPRNNTLSEDREALSNLVQNPTVKPSLSQTANPSLSRSIKTSLSPTMSASMNMAASANSPRRATVTRKSLAKSPFESLNGMPNESLNGMPNESSMSNEISESNVLGSRNMENVQNASRTVTTMKMNSNSKRMGTASSKQIATSTPPDIGADLVSSQTKSSTSTAPVMQGAPRGGTMLSAIKHKTAQLKSMLNLRSSTRKRK
jgi:hypothetical protein